MLIRNLHIYFLLMFALGATLYSQDIPPIIPNTYVQDHAQVLSPSDEYEIQQSLNAIKTKYNLEFGIAIVDSTGIYPIESYSLKMARTYGIGSKENDKRGLLLLIAVKDRKWRWEISRHIEYALTDSESGEIGRKILTPNLKAAMQTNQSRDWKVAIITTVKAIDAHIQNRIEPEKKTPVTPATSRGNDDDTGMIVGGSCCGGMILLMGIVWGLAIYNSGKGDREMKKKKKYEQRKREAWLNSPAGLAWTEAQKRTEADRIARETEEREKREEARKKYEAWLETPEGRAEAKRRARIEEAREGAVIAAVPDYTIPTYDPPSTSSDWSSNDTSSDSSSSSDSFSGGSDFGGGGSSGDF